MSHLCEWNVEIVDSDIVQVCEAISSYAQVIFRCQADSILTRSWKRSVYIAILRRPTKVTVCYFCLSVYELVTVLLVPIKENQVQAMQQPDLEQLEHGRKLL